jgi:endogenous inhibitor of DNA gyrase (YacG/DUF329 family)
MTTSKRRKEIRCMACGQPAMYDEYDGTQLNFCSQRCSESNIEFDGECE